MSQRPDRRIELIGDEPKEVIEGTRGMVKLQDNDDIVLSPTTFVPGDENDVPAKLDDQADTDY